MDQAETTSRSLQPVVPTRVAIGLVERAGRYLIRLRPRGSVMPGVWEFPGGKLEADESPRDAIVRECLEEAGLAVRPTAVRRVIVHEYPHGLIELTYWDCEPSAACAEPEARFGWAWVAAQRLPELEFPAANTPILHELARRHAAAPGADGSR